MTSVLAVDDLKSMRHMMSLTLQDAGFNVIKAIDGEDALGKVRSGHPDLILCDIDMPNMDGFELARNLRNIPAYSKVPIVLVSTNSKANATQREQAKAAGANGWMCKPLNPQQLIDTVQKVLK